MNGFHSRFLAIAALGLVAAVPAHASLVLGSDNICPLTSGHAAVNGGGAGNATDCNEIITFNSDFTNTSAAGAQTSFETEDDSLIGVVNNTNQTILSFNLSSNLFNIFRFDGDGIDDYSFFTCVNGSPGCVGGMIASNITPVAGNPDSTGYGGLDAFFTNVSALTDPETGTVNFAGGIAPGQTAFFSLEDPVATDLIISNLVTAPPTTGVPEPGTLALFGAGIAALGGFALRRRVARA